MSEDDPTWPGTVAHGPRPYVAQRAGDPDRTWRGSSISYEEYCDPAVLRFTVLSDWDFDEHWAKVWTTGSRQGIGAVRSQGRGVYIVTQWDKQKR